MSSDFRDRCENEENHNSIALGFKESPYSLRFSNSMGDLSMDEQMLINGFQLWIRELEHQILQMEDRFFLFSEQGQIMDLSVGNHDRDELISEFTDVVKETISNGQHFFKWSPLLDSSSVDNFYLIPIYTFDKQIVTILGMQTKRSEDQGSLTYFHSLALSFLPHVRIWMEIMRNQLMQRDQLVVAQEAKKRDSLFEVAHKIHSMIEVDSVLKEVTYQIELFYPSVQFDLFLSQDNHSSTLPVIPLNFKQVDEDICTKAFMDGELIHHFLDETNTAEIAAPLSGKQGVYGVLHLYSQQHVFDAMDIQFISMLAITAGSAFENAKLYEQSNLLINELRLINEITKRLNQSLKLNEIFNFASSELIKIFGAEFSCILQMDKDDHEMIVQASNLPAMFHEKFSKDYGFSGMVFESKEPLIISDYWKNPKVKSKLMESTGSRSLIGSPIILNNEVVGVILVAHRYPNFFSYDNYKLLQVLAGHIGLTIANASLHAEVKRMVITDNLTGLYARHYLDEQIGSLQKKDVCGSLIVVDIDNFKSVNDTHGHQVGDKILIQVSGIMKCCIRDSDIAARWGGEELAIYLPQVTIDQAFRIAERIRSWVANETDPKVTVSCGISEWNWEEDKISVELLFYKADMALYKAKHDGKNQIKIG